MRESSPSIRSIVSKGVLTIEICRVEKRNAISMQMWEEIQTLIGIADADQQISCGAIVSGVPGIFSSGGDLGEVEVARKTSSRGLEQYARRVGEVLESVRWSPIPWVSVIDGVCIGGAMQLAMACDIRIVSTRTTFMIPAVKYGLSIEATELALLCKLVGLEDVRRIALLSETVTADDRLFERLATAVCEPGDIDAVLGEWLNRLSKLDASAFTKTKRALWAAAHSRNAMSSGETGPATPSG